MANPVKFDTATILQTYLSQSKLDRYYKLLMELNRKVNLVSRETDRPDFDRLVAESVLPLDILPDSFHGYLDIGSGGGMPSVPLLMSGRIGGPVTLVERTGKKARALEQILSGLDLNAEILPDNFKEISGLGRYDLITLRYVKLTEALLGRVVSLLAADGSFVYYSTPPFEPQGIRVTVRRFQPLQDSVVKSFTIFSK